MKDRIVISAAHGDALFAETVIELGAVDDLRRELESEAPDLEACDRLGHRATDALRLIQDGGLGWGYSSERGAGEPPPHVELSLPAGELRRVVLGKRAALAQAQQMRQPEREAQESMWEQSEKAQEACNAILEQLAEPDHHEGRCHDR